MATKKAVGGVTRVAGFDGGNHEAVLTFDAKRLITAPNYLADGRMEDLIGLRSGSGERGSLNADEFVVEYQGRSYFFGKLAIEQGKEPRNNVGDNGRYWQHNLIALMALAGTAYSEDRIMLRMVTGLPVSVYKNRDTRDEIARRLTAQDEYLFRLNGRDRTLVLVEVKIVMEGQAAALLYGARNSRATQALIDLGGRTTGFIYLEEGHAVPDKCGMLESGVERVGLLLASMVKDAHKRTMKPRDVRKALRTWLIEKARVTITAGGIEVDISSLVDKAVRAVALEIEARARQLWTDSDDHRIAYDCLQVALVGGGVYYFADHLQQAISVPVIAAREPEMANARAYKALADKVWPATMVEAAPVAVEV